MNVIWFLAGVVVGILLRGSSWVEFYPPPQEPTWKSETKTTTKERK